MISVAQLPTVGALLHGQRLCLLVLFSGVLLMTEACGGGGPSHSFLPSNNTTPPAPPQQLLPLTKLSTDTFTNSTSQHATEVEPSAFAVGSNVVSAFQVGRIFSGGGADIGFATSTNGGATWSSGFLPGVTTFFQGGSASAGSDPAVAYDARHGVWIIASLAISATNKVIVSRSRDGILWENPVMVSTTPNSDKDWIACDNSSSSPFFGNCYITWDDPSNAGLVWMSRSSDGGLTWGAAINPADKPSGIGGQPIVQPNGTVIVPLANNPNNHPINAMLAFRSRDGGATWSATAQIAAIADHHVAGGLRTDPLPSAQIDSVGTVYLVWQDCSFRTNCASNDIVISTSTDGMAWTPASRVPIDPVSSTVDHFIPALAVDPTSSGAGAKLAVTYYFYPVANCAVATCSLSVGVITSADGGKSWTAPTTLVSGISLTALPNTFSGVMVGDYVATVFSGGKIFPIFALANPVAGTQFDEAIYTTTSGLPESANAVTFSSRDERPIANAQSDRPRSAFYDLEHRFPKRPQP